MVTRILGSLLARASTIAEFTLDALARMPPVEFDEVQYYYRTDHTSHKGQASDNRSLAETGVRKTGVFAELGKYEKITYPDGDEGFGRIRTNGVHPADVQLVV